MNLKSKANLEVDVNTLNLLPIALMLFDNTKIFFLNKKAIEILKMSPKMYKDIEQQSFLNFVNEKDAQRIKKQNNLILKGQVFEAIELELKSNKNKKVWIESKSNLVFFKNKKVVQFTFTEISERHTQKTELEVAKNLLNKITINCTDVIFDLSFFPQTKVNFISDASIKILGYSPEEIYREPLILKSQLYKDDQKHWNALWKNYTNSAGNKKERSAVLRFIKKTGETKFLEIIVNPIIGAKKQLIGIVGSMRDATKRIETESLLLDVKAKFDLITNNGNDIIAFYTFLPEEKYLYVVRISKRFLGAVSRS